MEEIIADHRASLVAMFEEGLDTDHDDSDDGEEMSMLSRNEQKYGTR